MEAAPAHVTAEAIGISPDVHQKLQETAAVLTQERKKKGKAIPENLTTTDAIRGYRTVASHAVNTD
jgi:pre-mRNA-processing factor 19